LAGVAPFATSVRRSALSLASLDELPMMKKNLKRKLDGEYCFAKRAHRK